MPKLRNFETDVGMFTQWLGRKVRNHNPLKELTVTASERTQKPRMYKEKASDTIYMVGDQSNHTSNTLLCEFGDRAFQVVVTEVDPGAYSNTEKTKVAA